MELGVGFCKPSDRPDFLSLIEYIRGNRVEPAEIEMALFELGNIREAVVVYCTTSPEACETYTCSPFDHEYFSSGRWVRNDPCTVN